MAPRSAQTMAPMSSTSPQAGISLGVTESFNGKFRDECLSLEWFRSRAEAKVSQTAPRGAHGESKGRRRGGFGRSYRSNSTRLAKSGCFVSMAIEVDGGADAFHACATREG